MAALWDVLAQPCCLGRSRPEMLDIGPQPDCYPTHAIAGARFEEYRPQRAKAARTRSMVIRRAEAASGGAGSLSSARVVRNARLEDHYSNLDQVLGTGMNGSVRLIRDKRTRRRCALKSIRLSSSHGVVDGSWEELIQEVEVYLRLDHPNICRLLEVYVDDKDCHMVMELCTGGELWQRQASHGKFSEQDARGAVLQMLEALCYLHRQGICHRDFKLENWLYADSSDSARLKLIDFGFSHKFSSGAKMTAVVGSIYYIAPEVWRASYDQKCDLWAVGVMAYELLNGSPPFDGDDDTAIRDATVRGDYSMSGSSWQGVSNDAKDFISTLLQSDPKLRPTAHEAARHSWLVAPQSDAPPRAADSNISVMEHLRDFASMNAMKRAACGLAALSMSVEEADRLAEQFRILDSGKNGAIPMQAFVEALKEHLGMADDVAAVVFQRLTLTGKAEIQYSEFLAAANQRRFLAQESVMRHTFQRFDTENKGFISVENLRAVLGHEYQGTKVEDMVTQVGYKGSGSIDYEEFVRAFTDLGSTDAGGGRTDDEACHRSRLGSVSRAFEFTSVGAYAGAARSPSGLRPLSRGWRTPDGPRARSVSTDKCGPATAEGVQPRITCSASFSSDGSTTASDLCELFDMVAPARDRLSTRPRLLSLKRGWHTPDDPRARSPEHRH